MLLRATLAHVRVLAASLAQHYPDRRLTVLVVDDEYGEVDAGEARRETRFA